MDYEDGVTLGQLLSLNVEVGRLALMRDKQQVHSMTVALSSLFDRKVLQSYNRIVDSALKTTEVVNKPNGAGSDRVPKTVEEKRAAAIHSVRELNKLNKLLKRG